MSIFMLYTFFVFIPNIHSITNLFIVILLLPSIISIIGFAICSNNNDKTGAIISTKIMRFSLITLLVTLIFNVTTFTETTAYKLAGGYIVTNIEDINKLPNNLMKAANSYLESVVKETDVKTEPKKK